jgi:hypothetical protein
MVKKQIATAKTQVCKSRLIFQRVKICPAAVKPAFTTSAPSFFSDNDRDFDRKVNPRGLWGQKNQRIGLLRQALNLYVQLLLALLAPLTWACPEISYKL